MNAGTVISICLDINEELGTQLKEDGNMNETIRKIFEYAFDLERQNGINEDKKWLPLTCFLMASLWRKLLGIAD